MGLNLHIAPEVSDHGAYVDPVRIFNARPHYWVALFFALVLAGL